MGPDRLDPGLTMRGGLVTDLHEEGLRHQVVEAGVGQLVCTAGCFESQRHDTTGEQPRKPRGEECENCQAQVNWSCGPRSAPDQ